MTLPAEGTLSRLYPLLFEPILKPRPWGGRRLEKLFGMKLPPLQPIGEAWTLSDRDSSLSVVANGPLRGTTLRSLMETHGAALMGRPVQPGERFPWLCKILDAQEDLSIQVHPPPDKAPLLGGETKSEFWWVAEAQPNSRIFAGIKEGVRRETLAAVRQAGDIQACFHQFPALRGDAIFLPSGRVHALGGGIVVFEIQENSDTTYRVFDWNRLGLDGKPRELHLQQAFESINFEDIEPAPLDWPEVARSRKTWITLVNSPVFVIERLDLNLGQKVAAQCSRTAEILCVAEGCAKIESWIGTMDLVRGTFCLLPARGDSELIGVDNSIILRVRTGADEKPNE